MKRPALFPVIDERVVTVYRVAAAQKGGVAYPTTAAIRDDMLDARTRVALDTLRAALIVNGAPMALRLAQLASLRLRDIVLWQRWVISGPPPIPPAWPVQVAW